MAGLRPAQRERACSRRPWLSSLAASDIPDMTKDDIHGYRTQFIFEVADIKDNHTVVDVDIALLREYTSEGTGSVFTQALCEIWTSATHM